MSDAGTQPVISPELLAILVCPVDKQELRLEGNRLICTACNRSYPIEDGIPNMLVDEDA
ncbi:MAG TPA: Trm112 family protein [Thermomicrobiales bacterium]